MIITSSTACIVGVVVSVGVVVTNPTISLVIDNCYIVCVCLYSNKYK